MTDILLIEYSGSGKLAQYTNNLAKALIKQGFSIAVASSKKEEFDGKFLFYRIKSRNSALVFLELLFLTKRLCPKIIHLQFLPSGLLLYLLTVFGGSKAIVTAHNLIPHHPKIMDFDFYRKAYEKASKVIVHSRFTGRVMEDIFGVKNYKVIPSMTVFEGGGKPQNREGLNILFFGYVSKGKGLDIALKAFSMARKESSVPLRLKIAGEFRDEVSYYEKLIMDENMGEDVEIHNGYVNNEKAKEYFDSADCVILPYRKTCQTPIIVQSFSAGLPVIASKSLEDDNLIDGKNSIIVDSCDTAGFKSAILKFANPLAIEEYKKNATETYEKNLSPEKIAKSHLEVYFSK